MSRYDNDPRVVKISDDRYDLPSPEGWYVERVDGRWKADAANESYTPMWSDSVDVAIYNVIGDPR